MIKELSLIADVTLVALIDRQKLKRTSKSEMEAIREIRNELLKICNRVSLVPHGALSRTANRLYVACKSLLYFSAYDVQWLKSKNYQRALDEVTSSASYDVVHIDTVGMWQYTKDLRPSKILNHHNIESAMMARRATKFPEPIRAYLNLQSRKLGRLESVAGAAAKMNLTCSQLDSNRLMEHVSCHCEVIPNGVDTDYFTRSTPYQSKQHAKLIFVGGLDWYPNREAVEFFFESIWPRITARYPQVSVTIVGRGTCDIANRYARITPNVTVTGFVDDVRPYIEDHSVFVCPIMDGGGTKLKILDAFAMGIPVVANPIACEGIDVIPGEHYIPAISSEDYVRAIGCLQENEAVAQHISRNARLLIEREYAYSVIRKKIHDVYRQSAERKTKGIQEA
jgi:glycosyltransferase involved in cell wall biosynthesis